jgi:hypothetical protein
MTPEIPQAQLRNCLVARQPAGVRGACGDERVGELLAAARPAADDPFELRVQRQVREPHAVHGETGLRQPLAELDAG